ncbi:hypothetical protein MKK88_22310 [Methylobacterium sp. E-005]|uniref:hypothetical protein n=1 Tax=Methylobacterium sp. E-005 TaxID=2836549 RepID=UPI001FB8DA2F|nr:hypothetical protein [Methylobacterium sp. E-005]MCJ2088690.1 hypothetical protein [Methylobacterium sp. E-005]
MFTKTARLGLAAALAVGGLSLAVPAMAAPLGVDAGLRQGAGDVVTVQYGYGYGPRHHGGWRGHGGFGPPRHHGWGRGHHYGWGPRGFGPRHHHHGGWGHRHGYGRW